MDLGNEHAPTFITAPIRNFRPAHMTGKRAIGDQALPTRNYMILNWCRGRESNPHDLTVNGF